MDHQELTPQTRDSLEALAVRCVQDVMMAATYQVLQQFAESMKSVTSLRDVAVRQAEEQLRTQLAGQPPAAGDQQ